ncbi:MAG: hypothetical protein Q7K03_02090 [Dehalococcoidia bacterium]|nr:hypothetical protein [Dehalococcoidia bacterium]
MAKVWFALVALVLLAVPPIALADSAQTFTASGNICLAGLPQIVVGSPQPTGVRIVAKGEELAGGIAVSSGWDDLEGAAVDITITNESSFFDFTTGTFSGSLNGTLTVTTTEDDVLKGKLEGKVSGVFLDPEDILGSIIQSTTQVKWQVNSKDAKASGQGNATFTPTELGFCGPLNLAGAVRET